jgi:thioredoxin reductase (NADPH)
VDAALESWRAGAEVTMVHFGRALDPTIKAWVLPDIANRIKVGSIGMRWQSRVTAITPDDVAVTGPDGRVERIPADAVLAMTGYHPDTSLLAAAGVPVDESTGIPAHDETTMMTPVPGLYLAGVIASGNDANRLFIENARGHGELIVRDILARTGR